MSIKLSQIATSPLTGPTGATGVIGTTGPIGSSGPLGPVGASGATGTIGPIGSTGPIGATGIGATGSVIPWTYLTSNTQLSNNMQIIANTAGGSFAVTLPANPGIGSAIIIEDGYNFSQNNLIVVPNGSGIANVTGNLIINVGQVLVYMIYAGTQWQVSATVGSAGATGPQGIGATGSIGPIGASGIVGASGVNTTGATGSIGLTGATGPLQRRIYSNTTVGSNLTINWASYDEARLTLSSNAASIYLTFSGAVDSQGCILKLTQGVGNSTVVLPNVVRYSTTIANYSPTLAVGGIDKLGFLSDLSGNTYYDLLAVILNI